MNRSIPIAPVVGAWLLVSFAVLFTACSPNEPVSTPSDDLVPPPPASADAVVVPRSAKGRAPVIDRSTPEGVLASIKDIIATDAMDSLRSFCHPAISVVSPVKLMCAIGTEDMDQIDKFRTWFSSARMDSAIMLNGDTARIPLTLAPGHPARERHATLMLLRHEGTYYLNNLVWRR